MDNFSYSSYPDSVNSSPRSREVDCENSSWDEPPSNYRVKFMCSYGGQILPRPHDNQLTYVGGDTKILAVDRGIKFFGFIQKLSSLCDTDVCFKYQLPGEDLDALISVTNDEDLEHMMLEYDRLYRASAKPARLRLFVFPSSPPSASSAFGSGETKSERQWFVDALNSVQIHNIEVSSPPAAVVSAVAANPDYMFGFDKGHAPPRQEPKLQEPPPAPTVPEVFQKDKYGGLEDRQLIGDPVVPAAEMQRQMHEFQRLQISGHEQSVFSRKVVETNPMAYPVDYYTQRVPEKGPPPQQPTVPVTIPAAYWQERHMTSGGYSVATAPATEPPVYIVPAPAGVYQAPSMRPATATGQAYYGVQRMMPPEIYREQPVYNAVPPPSVQNPKFGAYSEAIGMVRPPPASGVGMAEPGFSYDGAGRHVYYAAPGGLMPPYQVVTTAASAVDARQAGGAATQEGKTVAKPSQTPSM